MHTHKTLAYLLFLLALLGPGLILAGAQSNPNLAKWAGYVHNFGVLMLGRLNIVLGLVLGLWLFQPIMLSLGGWWMWITILLWAPVEIVGKRMVKAELQVVQDGGEASGALIGGAVIQLLVVVIIFGLMSARPTF